MRLTFDPKKRDRTLMERSLDLARCGEIFGGPNMTQEDARAGYGGRVGLR